MGFLDRLAEIGHSSSKAKRGAGTAVAGNGTVSKPTSTPKPNGPSAAAPATTSDSKASKDPSPASPVAASSNTKASSPAQPTISPTSPDNSLLIQLAQTITTETAALSSFLKSRGDPEPSFDASSITDYTHLSPSVTQSRHALLAALSSLHDLVLGPVEKVRWLAWDFGDQLSLSFVNYYAIATLFPLSSTISFSDISSKIGVDETNVARLIRHAITNRIFVEVSPGVIAHTAASRVLAEDGNMQNWIGFTTEDIWPASAATLTAMKLNPGSQENTQSGFQVANGTVDVEPLFATMGKNPERAKRFGKAMTSLTGGEGYEISYLVEGSAAIWSEVDERGGTVVDIGGSHGVVCVEVAKKYKRINFVVQDLPKMIASAPDLGDEAITFMGHDFFTEQPVKNADIYFFRWIFHNQSTKYAILILQALIPALKPGARILINDNVLPDLGQDSLYDEKITRSMDLVMLTLLNAQERTKEDFKKLFELADARFKLVNITREKGCRMSVVEAVWEEAEVAEESVAAVAATS